MVLSASLFKDIADGGILTNANGTSEMNPSAESIEAQHLRDPRSLVMRITFVHRLKEHSIQ